MESVNFSKQGKIVLEVKKSGFSLSTFDITVVFKTLDTIVSFDMNGIYPLYQTVFGGNEQNIERREIKEEDGIKYLSITTTATAT